MRNAASSRSTWGLWIGLLVAAQLADLATTAASISHGGLETNPLVTGIVATGGISGYVLVKLASVLVVVALIGAAAWLRRWLPVHLAGVVFRSIVVGLQVAVGIQVFAVAANLLVLGGQLGA